jgi:Nucleotide modification associated domain 2
MPSIYFYKLTVDNGGAPCVERGLLSLAICKPKIRVTARPGDLIFGFAGKSLRPDNPGAGYPLGDNPLIYIARVTDKKCNGDYYRGLKFTSRRDCIYRWESGHFEWRQGAAYHSAENLEHDLGWHPNYPNAKVLLSDDFEYLGCAGDSNYKRKFPCIKAAVEQLTQGHRVYHDEVLREQLLALKDQVWKEIGQRVAGEPSNTPRRGMSDRSNSCGICQMPGKPEARS